MKPIRKQDIVNFLKLQNSLMLEFYKSYPSAKDNKWLLDFPTKGTMQIGLERWEFTKHGAGLRFLRLSCNPHVVVNIHKRINEPRIIDEWRLLEFFQSCDWKVTEGHLNLLLGKMLKDGDIINTGDEQYIFIGDINDQNRGD